MGPHGGEASEPRLAHGKSACKGRSVVVTLPGADAAGDVEFFVSNDGLSGGTCAQPGERPGEPDLYGNVFHFFEEGTIDEDADRGEVFVWREVLSRILPGRRPVEAVGSCDRSPNSLCLYRRARGHA